ncbi:MAG: radical SAM protein [Syntrophorhabdaceae bacterium]|nr:radical SAM protein [Syntrophorhabdaceae bacterium]
MIVPVFLTHLGCHDRCIYCNQGYITAQNDTDVRRLVERSLQQKEGTYEVGLFGGNIFGLSPDYLKRLFGYFDDYREKITNFRISTKPAPLNEELINILMEQRVTVIELGIPSFNNNILGRLNRKHTVEDLLLAFYTLKDKGFQVALQFMVGLPGETFDDIREAVASIARLKPHYIRIYPLAVLKETPLCDLYEERKFIPIEFNEVLERALYIYLNALQHDIKVVKMGLTDNEILKERIVAGYYHPAFGYLVKSYGFYRAIQAAVERESMKGKVTVILNKRDIPHLLGHRRDNMKGFEEQGLRVSWETADMPVGTFKLISGSGHAEGTIFDAIPTK